MTQRIVPAHDDVRRLLDVIHYADHPERTESTEFVAIRKHFHDTGAKCYIDNGYCDGHTEIHHGEIEYSASTEVDWQRINADLGFDHVDSVVQMVPLCHKHHMGVGTGKHMVTDPAWKLQKYLLPEPLALFEAAVKHLIDAGHPDHHVNATAHKMLIHVAKRNDAIHDGTVAANV